MSEKHKPNRELNTLNIIKWFWNTSKSYRFQACLNAFIGVLKVAIDFAFIATTKLAIDIATGRSDKSLNLAIALLITVILSQIAIGFCRKWIAALLGVRAQNRMQHQLFKRLMNSEWRGLDNRHSGDVLNRLERDVSDVTTVITDTLPSAISVGVRLIGAFLYLYTMDAMLACLIMVIVPLFILLSKLYIKKMRDITREVRQTDSKIQSILTESVQHRMVLKTLERTNTMADRLARTQSELRKQVRNRTIFSSFSGTLLNVGFATGYLVTFIWGVGRLHDGTITYGMMTAFIQLVGQIQGPFREMTRFVPIIVGSLTAGERLMELEETPLEMSGRNIKFNGSTGIRINNVTYAYDPEKRTILKNLTYDFPPGSTTAILGETGAGKTTLIRLILALIRPQEGSIEMYTNKASVENENNTDANVSNTDANVSKANESNADTEKGSGTTPESVVVSPLTRCNTVYVPQGNTLFSGTIRDNLLLGNPKATEEDMRWALECACADFVLQKEDGLDILCGEQGQGMSEGQAQRISIARALLRKGNILLLDEATSALDMETEKRLLNNLTTMLDKQQTIIFITHRMAVVDHCNQVLKLARN